MPAGLSALGIRFNLLLGAVWNLAPESGAAFTAACSNATDASLWAVPWRLDEEQPSLQLSRDGSIAWGADIAYYWRNPTPAEKRREKSTHSFSGDEAGRSQSRISRHFDMIPYD